MNQEKLDLIFTLFQQGRTRKEMAIGANITITELDIAIKEGLSLYAQQLEQNEPEFNEKTHVFSTKGFENNVDFLCARIESDPEFSLQEVSDLADQGIETNYDLIKANHPLQERLREHFSITVDFPIVILPQQDSMITEQLQKN